MALLAVGASTLLALATAEIILRIAWDRPPLHHIGMRYWKYMRSDGELGQLPKPNTVVEYPRFNASFSTNSFGFRGPEVAVARAPGKRRVVVLGDSFAWGHGVSTGQAFPEVLQTLLPDTEVINLGVPGFNVRTELRYFERAGAQFQPDVVLLALCQNDIHDLDALEQGRRNRAAAPKAPVARAPEDDGSISRSVKQFLSDHCYVYDICCRAINANKPLARAAVKLGLKEDLAGFELLDDNLHASLINYPPTVQTAMEQIQRDLTRLDASVRAHGSRLVVALVPALQAVEREELVHSLAYTRYEVTDFDMDKPYRLLAGFAADRDIRIISPLEAFRARHAAGASLYLPGDLHFDRDGHGLFAEAVAPALSSMLDAAR